MIQISRQWSSGFKSGKPQKKLEARARVERIEAWRKGLLELTDIEIYELGAKVLTDKLGVPVPSDFCAIILNRTKNPMLQQSHAR